MKRVNSLRHVSSDTAWRCSRQESDRAGIAGRLHARVAGGPRSRLRSGGRVCGRLWPGAARAVGMQLGSEDGRIDFIRAEIAGTLAR